MKRRTLIRNTAPLAGLALLVCSLTAGAESVTLERIADSGIMHIGYVPDAPPMSFDSADGKTAGYSIDLCRQIAAAVKTRLGRQDIAVEYVPLVAPAERIAAVESGKVDIECGATTVTLSRRARVDFTLMTYITGGTVVSTKKRPIRTLEELPGHTIAVIDGTTTEEALRHFGDSNDFRFKMRLIKTHEEGMRLLKAGDVDGYASDRVMLIGQVVATPEAANYVVAPSVFSFEPYSLMVRRGDTEFRLLADSALASLYRDARIRRLYQTWFGRYGEPMSPLVSAMYEFQAVSD